MSPATVQQQQEKETWEADQAARRRAIQASLPKPQIPDAPLIDQSGGFMAVPASVRPGSIPSLPMAPIQSTGFDTKLMVLSGVGVVLAIAAVTIAPILGLIVVLLFACIVVNTLMTKSADAARISTGPEMDAVLIAQYNKDVEKYRRKLQAAARERDLARASNIQSGLLGMAPTPPKRPTLSTERQR